MKRLYLTFFLILLSIPALAQTPPTDTKYLSGFTAAGALADTDTFALCQVSGGCDSSQSQVRASGSQLTTYVRGKLSSSSVIGYNSGTGALTLPLASGHLLVGSVGGAATDVAASGDLTLASTGAFTLATVNGSPGTFTNATLTVNAKGLVTAASTGSGGSSGLSGMTAGQIPVAATASTVTSSFAVGGDATLNTTTGALTLATIGTITPGAYTNTNITVDAKGRITLIANGSSAGTGIGVVGGESAVIVGNADSTIAAGHYIVRNTASLTAARVWTLPSCTTTGNHLISFWDEARGITSTNTGTLLRAGSDTIAGGTSWTMAVPGASVILECDGTSKWTIVGNTPAFTPVSSQWLTGITPAGVWSASQPACANLSNGATGCSTAVGTSGATLGLLNANKTDSGSNTFSGNNTYSGTAINSAPTHITATGNVDATLIGGQCQQWLHYDSTSAGTLTILNTAVTGCDFPITAINTGLATVAAQSSGTIVGNASCVASPRTKESHSVIWIHIQSNAGTAPVISVSGDCG